MKKYPTWLNAVSWLVIAGVPIGVAVAILWETPIGAAICAISFFGITIFGSVAERYDDV